MEKFSVIVVIATILFLGVIGNKNVLGQKNRPTIEVLEKRIVELEQRVSLLESLFKGKIVPLREKN